MNKDGSSNVRRAGLRFYESTNLYHELITMAWIKFFFLVFFSYIIVNFLFAFVYFLIDPNHIGGMIYTTQFEKFKEIFFFSAQSLTTVGYGRLNPTSTFNSSLAAIESLTGLLGFALFHIFFSDKENIIIPFLYSSINDLYSGLFCLISFL